MERTESGRGGEDHDIHAAIEHLLIGVQSDKLPLVIDIDFALATFADMPANGPADRGIPRPWTRAPRCCRP